MSSSSLEPIPCHVGIVGVGNMGGGMARRLLHKGYTVHVVDIDASKTKALAELGAKVHASASDCVHQCSAIIVSVVDAAQTQTIVTELIQHTQNGRNGRNGRNATTDAMAQADASLLTRSHKWNPPVVLLCPTIAPQDAERFAKALHEQGFGCMDAPMSGGPKRAADGTMSLMVACEGDVYAKHQKLLGDLAHQVFHISTRVGDGARMKLVNNLLAGIHLVGAAQSVALAQKLGLDGQKALAVMQASSAQSWIGHDRMSRALAGDYAPRAHMTLLAKDTQLAVDMAQAAGFMPSLGEPTAQAFAQAALQGYAQQDDAALLAFFQSKMGLTP